jgi:thioesterase domain-containing protein
MLDAYHPFNPTSCHRMTIPEFASLQDLLHREIPVSAEMGITIVSASPDLVRLEAPLMPNINYNGTAFGGSIYTVAALSSWLLVSAALTAEGHEAEYVVIQDGAIEYLQPATDRFEAESAWPSDESRPRFLRGLDRRGISRSQLAALVTCKGTVCASFEGRFVARVRHGG